MLKRTIALFFALAVTVCAQFPYHDNTGAFNATTNATGSYDAFSWNWMGYDDQTITVTLLPSGSTAVAFRMCYPKRGTIFVSSLDGTLTGGTNYTLSIARTNLPPDGIYFAEFLGYVGSVTTVPARVLATGQINVQHSLFQNTTQSTWTNPLAGTVIGPPLHTLSTLTNWPFLSTNMIGSGLAIVDGMLVTTGEAVSAVAFVAITGEPTDNAALAAWGAGLGGTDAVARAGVEINSNNLASLSAIALTNGSLYATAAQGALADKALTNAAAFEAAGAVAGLSNSVYGQGYLTSADPLGAATGTVAALSNSLGSAAFVPTSTFDTEGSAAAASNGVIAWAGGQGYLTNEPYWSANSNDAMNHVRSSHRVNGQGGFEGGIFATSVSGCAIGYWSRADDGGAVGRGAKTGNGFAGGYNAFATSNGLWEASGIDAIQLGSGGNSNPLSLKVYGYTLMDSNGVIPSARINVDLSAYATNIYGANRGALAIIDGAGIAAAGGVTNGGATINGSAISNGAAITIAAGGTSTSDVQTIAWNSQRTPYQIASAVTVTVLAAWGNLMRLDVAHSPCTITAEAGVYATNYTFDVTLELYAGTNTIAWNTAVYTNTTLLDIGTNNVTTLNLNKPQRNVMVGVRQ